MSKGVGIYIGSNEVIAVSAIRTPVGPRIKSSAIEPIQPLGAEGPSAGKDAHRLKKMSPVGRAIFRALEKIGEKGAYVTVAVSPSHVATRQFVMPVIPRKDESGAIQHEASRYMPFKAADSFLHYFKHENSKKVLLVIATAIRKSIIQTSLQDLHAASAKTLMLEPVHCAVSRAFSAIRMTGPAKVQGFIVVQSDGNVNVTIAFERNVGLSRDFLLSGNPEEDKQRFTEELSASINYFYKLTGGEAVEQFFLSGAGDLKAWVETLEKDFNYKIRFDIPKFPEKEKIPAEGASAVWVAFGLALRDLNYRSTLGEVKLLPSEDRQTESPKLLFYLGFQSLAILIAFLLIRLVFFQPYLSAISRPHAELLASINQEDPLFGTKNLPQLESEKQILTAKRGQLDKFFGNPVSAFALFSAIGRGLPQAVSLDSVSLEVRKDQDRKGSTPGAGDKRINLRGVCYLGNAEKETAVVSVWVKSLASKKAISDYFPEIKVAEIKREKDGKRDLTRFLIINE